MNFGWFRYFGDGSTSHYYIKEKTEWPEYPMDDGKGDGWHSYFKSLCGKSTSWARGKNPKMPFAKKIEKKSRPCTRCLIIIAKEKGLL